MKSLCREFHSLWTTERPLRAATEDHPKHLVCRRCLRGKEIFKSLGYQSGDLFQHPQKYSEAKQQGVVSAMSNFCF